MDAEVKNQVGELSLHNSWKASFGDRTPQAVSEEIKRLVTEFHRTTTEVDALKVNVCDAEEKFDAVKVLVERLDMTLDSIDWNIRKVATNTRDTSIPSSIEGSSTREMETRVKAVEDCRAAALRKEDALRSEDIGADRITGTTIVTRSRKYVKENAELRDLYHRGLIYRLRCQKAMLNSGIENIRQKISEARTEFALLEKEDDDMRARMVAVDPSGG